MTESKGRVRVTTMSTVSRLNTVSNADGVIENYLEGVLANAVARSSESAKGTPGAVASARLHILMVAYYLCVGYTNSKPA